MRSCGLSARVRRTVQDLQLFGSGDSLLVAVSGGADSTCLAHVLPDVAASFDARIVGLAHLNHQLRSAAAEDEAFCAALADRLGLPFFVDRADVAAEARQRRASIEDAGRTVRYAFLAAKAREAGATRVAVAHTLNDQAETVLLRLLRGAGPVGLAGIYPRSGLVIRPLIDVTRAEVEIYLQDTGLSWRDDDTNRDVTIPRNRVRHELLPWLRTHFGSGVDAVLARQAPLFREDAEHLDCQATEIARGLVLHTSGRTDVSVRGLVAQPPALARRILLTILREHAGERFVGFQHVEAVLALARGDETRGAIDLPGQRVERRGDTLTARSVPPDPSRAGRKRGKGV
jgi:tRNA(Ile)-lysidine synthase